jgi:uncharacterized protein
LFRPATGRAGWGTALTPHGEAAALLGAGVLAGVVGTAGGITSLVSYPALLAVGVPALPASIANLVAAAACWPGAALASRPELAGRGRWLLRWTPVAAVGGAAGSVLLLSTPAGVFARVVPFLVLAGALALLREPRASSSSEPQRGPGSGPVLAVGLLLLSVYSGYFGAGSGVMTLALLLYLADPQLPTANALKNMLVGAATLISAAVFIIHGSVDWSAAVPLGIGMFAGSTVGPRVARQLPAAVLRWSIALLGVALAIQLWVTGGH